LSTLEKGGHFYFRECNTVSNHRQLLGVQCHIVQCKYSTLSGARYILHEVFTVELGFLEC